MIKNRFIQIVTCFITSTFINNMVLAQGVKLPGNIAVHIAKLHYEHPVRLLHPYLDVWHMKGPLAEKAALKELGKRFANIHLCKSGESTNVVLLLEPHMFYNAQLRVFHGEIIARVFTNASASDLENPIVSIKKQAQQNGELGIKPEFYMEKAYVKAMDKVIKKLETDKSFLAAIDTTANGSAANLCAALDDLPFSKIYY
jgi:hypothetical protein